MTAHEGVALVAPAPSLLGGPPPYSVDLGGPGSDVTTSPVRLASSVYVLDKTGAYQYEDALAQCRCGGLWTA